MVDRMSTHDHTPLPRRGERFADPTTNAIWAAIVALPVALQHVLLDELRTLLGRNDKRDSHAARVQVAITAARRRCP